MKTKLQPYLNSFCSNLNYGKNTFGNKNLFIEDKLISNNKEKSLDIQENEVLFRYIIHNETLNYWGAMHGGAISTLIDIASTIAITGLDKTSRKNISIELSTKFLLPAKPNNDIYVLCKVPKIGKNIAYSTIELIDTDNLKVIATASHTKAMLDSIWEINQKI